MTEDTRPEPAAEGGQPNDDGGANDPNRRRGRRGRRGRGGGGQFPVPGNQGGFRPPMQGGGFRPPRPQGAFRPPPRYPDQFRAPPRPPMGGMGGGGGMAPVGDDDDSSSQARELAAYERRQRGGRPGGMGGGGGFRPQGGGGGGWRRDQRRGGEGYQEAIRRVTGGPRQAAPSHDAGEPLAGPHAVLEAIRAGRVLRSLYISQDRGLRTGAVNELIMEAQQRRIFVRYVDKLELSRLSPTENHQGVVAIVEGRAGVDIDELLLHIDTIENPLVLVLDQLQDPQNFGVLLRSAEGAGAAGVVIPKHRAVGLTPAVARTSAGASEHLLISDVPNLRQAIDALKEKGVWVVGTDMSGDLLYDEVDYRGPTALVVGSEGEGIRRLVLEGCDQVVRIPMLGKVESLNAAAAGTVLLFEAVRQRQRNAAPSPTRTPRPAPPPPPAQTAFDDDEDDEDEDDDEGLSLDDEVDEAEDDDLDDEIDEAEEPVAPPPAVKKAVKKAKAAAPAKKAVKKAAAPRAKKKAAD